MKNLNEIKVKFTKSLIKNKSKIIIIKSILILLLYSLLSYYTELEILEICTLYLLYYVNKR